MGEDGEGVLEERKGVLCCYGRLGGCMGMGFGRERSVHTAASGFCNGSWDECHPSGVEGWLIFFVA